MDIVINCPQCGADVDLDEEDTVFRCLYCGSTLKPTGRNGVQSFYISPCETPQKVARALLRTLGNKLTGLHLTESILLYAPYWQVKGMLFQWIFGKEFFRSHYNNEKTWDSFKKLNATQWFHTFPAFESSKWSLLSLGLRARVLKIWPYNKKKMGEDSLLLKQNVSFKEAVNQTMQSIEYRKGIKDIKVELVKSELIGEHYSLIYFPFYCYIFTGPKKKSLVIVDALSHKTVKGNVDIDKLKQDTAGKKIPYRPLSLIPFKCPNCGWDFPYKPHTSVHMCTTCGRAWRERNGHYIPVPYIIFLDGEAKKDKYKFLAFWRFIVNIKTSAREYKRLDEFYDLYPLSRLMDKEKSAKRSITFYVPAVKIKNARAVDKLAVQLTRTQPVFKKYKPAGMGNIDMSDIWLDLKEAKEMAHLLLLSMTKKDHRKTKEVIREAVLHFKNAGIILLPFKEKGIYLREVHTDFALQKNAVDLG